MISSICLKTSSGILTSILNILSPKDCGLVELGIRSKSEYWPQTSCLWFLRSPYASRKMLTNEILEESTHIVWEGQETVDIVYTIG